MAVSEQTPYIEYTANGTTTSFALDFDCDNQNHLIVLIDGIEPVVGTWSLSNGAVVFNTAPENGKKITLQRNTPFSRTTDYQSYNNSFRPPAVNNDFDRVWFKIQELGVKDWLLDLKIQKFRDDVNLTALENTLEEARQIRDDTADSVIEVQSNVAQSQTLLGNTTAQANLAQGYASSANSANAAAQQAVIDVSTAEADVYSALSAQQIAVNNSLTAIAGGHKAYQTLAAAQAAQGTLPANSIVEVTNDGANNGTYLWNGTTLTKSDYDPLTQSKNYTNDTIKPLSVKLAALATDQYSGSYENVIPFYSDSSGKVILGFNESTEELIGAFPENVVVQDYVAKPLPFELKPIAAAANGIISYGQSLSIGMTSSGLNTPISTTQHFYNLTFSPSVKSTIDAIGVKPLVEDDVLPVGSDTGYSGETPCSGAANYASLLAYKENGVKPENHKIFSSACGKGASTIGALLNTSAWYLEHFIGTLDKAVALNTGFKLHAVAWEQGESDASADVAYATYYSRLNQLQAGIETDAKSRTGQTSPVHFITASLSTRIKLGEGPVKAMFDAVKNNPKIHFSTPTHFIPRVDGTHLTQVGYKWLGAFYGRVYKQLVIDQIEPKWLEPISVIQKSNVIDIKYRVPCKPLQLNTSFLAATTDMGFKVLDGSTVAIITNIEIVNNDTVRLTLSENPTNAVTLRYGLDYLGVGLDVNEGCSGNVMDSTSEKCTINNVDYLMPYVSPHFEMIALKEQF